MLDVLVFIGLVNVSFFGLYSLFVLPGLLLAGCVLAAYAYFDLLPSTMWTHGRPSFYDCLQMAIIQDGIQFCLHMLEHRFHFQSHRVHHRHVHPTSLDAFHTGTMDGLIQLVLPLWITLHVVEPNKTSAALFGTCYALWLQWIHADNTFALKLRSKFFVTPTFHRRHHTHPCTNFGHILTLWDWLCGTAYQQSSSS